MVYQGPSRGCNSCRHRRKKSCLRCINAGRTCGGYEDTAASAYHRSEVQRADASPFVSIARKCSLPPRFPIPGTHLFQDDVIPAETSQAESNSLSLRAFLYDFCVISTNQDLSKGYLSGLEMMVRRSGLDSDLAKACQAVSFALHGKPLNRPKMVHKAASFYHDLLGSMARTIQSPGVADTNESRIVVMLLGLYQMVMASEVDSGCHGTHAKGLAALMGIGNSYLNLLGKTCGVFSIPALGDGDQSLDDLLLSLDRLATKSETASAPEDVERLRNDCMALDRRFAIWQTTRIPGFNPTVVGQTAKTDSGSIPRVGYWPGSVHTYFDLYVAGVWNIFRAARLSLLALIVKLSEARGESSSHHVRVATCVVDDIIASVPYHLTESLPAFIRQLESGTDIQVPGRFLGGLLLMHPLYVASQMQFPPADMRQYLRACLLWIGSNMGIGQATVLANATNVNSDYLSSGCMIVWAGFLW